jgi:hypothetical protein
LGISIETAAMQKKETTKGAKGEIVAGDAPD